MPKTVTCTNHCGSCGLHFHSVKAFDAHRQGDFASNDPVLGRHCVHPLDMDGRLVALTGDGVCRMYEDASRPGEGVQRQVTIWTLAGFEERSRQLRVAHESGP
jgi:hypothetical protein